MESYKIYRKFLDKEFCDNIILDYKKYFIFKPRDDWKSWVINDSNYEKYILEKYKSIIPDNLFNSWINLTIYNVGDDLRMHRDVQSKFTIVSNLNDGYEGGGFKINDEIIKLDLGDVIVFNGNLQLHGVSKVFKGIRYSLNLWNYDDERMSSAFKKPII
jgi:hypothetical protein